jgi:G3E family GTPase
MLHYEWNRVYNQQNCGWRDGMAAHSTRIMTAQITSEGDETVIRLSGHIDLPSGPASVRVTEQAGEVILTPVAEMSDRHKEWLAFLDELAARPVDEEFMKERPMNRVPVEEDFFRDA